MFALNTRWARLLLALVCGLASSAARAEYRDPVSYTHLTLPTIYSV